MWHCCLFYYTTLLNELDFTWNIMWLWADHWLLRTKIGLYKPVWNLVFSIILKIESHYTSVTVWMSPGNLVVRKRHILLQVQMLQDSFDSFDYSLWMSELLIGDRRAKSWENKNWWQTGVWCDNKCADDEFGLWSLRVYFVSSSRERIMFMEMIDRFLFLFLTILLYF